MAATATTESATSSAATDFATSPDTAPLRGPSPLLESCERVYLDFGTNIGFKLRELYDPHVARVGTRRPSTFFAPLNLTANFTSRSDVCALAFEPVPRNVVKCNHVVQTLRRRALIGPHVHFFPAAIGTADGTARFYVDDSPNNIANNWGSSLLRWQRGMENRSRVDVPVVGLSTLLERHVPAAAKVVAKMDVEGAEYDVVPAALNSICAHVDVLYLEMHHRFFSPKWRGHRSDMTDDGRIARLRDALATMKKRSHEGQCRTKIVSMGSAEREVGAFG